MQMERWEFLLQREGDTTWLPLESPDVEILEGRYRVVARSGHPNTKIEVRITHHALEEVPPVRRTQSRMTITSEEGLMVVLPHTRLKPGIWELYCSPQVISSQNHSGEQQVKLRVLSNDSEPLDQPHPSEQPLENYEVSEPSNGEVSTQVPVQEDNLLEVEPQSDTPEARSQSLQNVASQDPELEEMVVSQTESSPNSEASEAVSESVAQTPSVSPDILDDQESQSLDQPIQIPDVFVPPVELTLNPDTYVAKLGQGLLISGQIKIAASYPSPQGEASEEYCLPTAQVQVCLRDPQNTNILIEIQQTIPHPVLPIPFACLVYIPFECQTRLILGEAIVYSDRLPVASCSFTIATQVEHLLEVIEEDFGEESEPDEMVSEIEISESAFPLHLPLTPAQNLPSSDDPASVPPIPRIAKLKSPTTDKTSASGLELPSFGRFLSEGSEHPVEPSPSSSEDTSTEPQPSDTETEVVTPSVEVDSSSTTQGELVPVSPVDPAFRSLNLQNRFFSRLNAMAQDQDLSQWMKQAKPTPLPDTSFVQTRSDASSSTPQPSRSEVASLFVPPSEDIESQEIVVDDEPLEVPPSQFSRPRPVLALDSQQTAQLSDSETPVVLSEEEPIPAPILDVLTQEVVAGRPVKVRVRLPDNLPRIYVKIWVYDRQSRTIVDGPRWLTEFSPNGLDQIETTLNLEIAYGSLEVQFEAIAIEMQTQRESHKVIVERSVIPPTSPILPLDEG